MKIFLILAAFVIIAALIAQFVSSNAFTAKIDTLRQTLLKTQVSVPPDQALIPQLVREFALRNGGQVGGSAALVMTQRAEMRLQPDQPFFHIDATQLTGSRNPGFVWHATGAMGGIIPLQVVDSYVAGSGDLEARIAGSITVAHARGPDIDKGEAMRFLAELAWNPDAILNAAGLAWREIDGQTVEVTLETTSGSVLVTLLFDEAGDIVAIEATDRPRSVGKANIPTPWVGRFSNYERDGAYRWPRHGEVGWILPEGEFIYWRGDILNVTATGER